MAVYIRLIIRRLDFGSIFLFNYKFIRITINQFLKNKIKAIIYSVGLIIFLSASFVLMQMIISPQSTSAGVTHNIYGWAWNGNTGWISFNSLNCDVDSNTFIDLACGGDNATTPITDYGVNIEANGNLTGHAWSELMGWIWFDPSDVPGTFDPSYSAWLDINTDEISGWARICQETTGAGCTGGNDGWIKMKKAAADPGSDYGVTLRAGFEFHGHAYNEDDDGNGIGWISFNCREGASDGSSVCDIANYFVAKTVNTIGYAWSNNIGWLSFSCKNEAVDCGNFYGVAVDPDTLNFAGYAWSENIGWLSFDASTTPPNFNYITN